MSEDQFMRDIAVANTTMQIMGRVATSVAMEGSAERVMEKFRDAFMSSDKIREHVAITGASEDEARERVEKMVAAVAQWANTVEQRVALSRDCGDYIPTMVGGLSEAVSAVIMACTVLGADEVMTGNLDEIGLDTMDPLVCDAAESTPAVYSMFSSQIGDMIRQAKESGALIDDDGEEEDMDLPGDLANALREAIANVKARGD